MFGHRDFLQRIKNWLTTSVGFGLIRILHLTCHFRQAGEVNRLKSHDFHPKGAYLLAAWHDQIIPLVISQAGHPMRALVSQAGGGQLIGQICKKYKYKPISGSQDKNKNKGGLKALLAIRKELANGMPSALTVDGSVGPRHFVKAGIIDLAARGKVAILPFGCAVEKYWELNTWDRMKIPKPFSQIVTSLGEPIFIPQSCTKEEYAIYQEKVKQAIHTEEHKAEIILNQRPS